MCIRLFSSEMELSILRLVSEIPALRLLLFCEVGVKEINLGIIFPPRAVTLIIALRVPLGPVTLTSPVGKDLRVVLPAKLRR